MTLALNHSDEPGREVVRAARQMTAHGYRDYSDRPGAAPRSGD
jgi:hypothetical protein